MGRPLNKRFFGNRNIGTGGAQGVTKDANGNITRRGGDDGIGGEGLATIANPSQLGSILVCSTATTVPALVIPPANLPGGVQATAQVTWEVESVYVATPLLNGHGYAITTGTTLLTGLGGGATFSITAVGSGQQEVQTIVPANRGSFTTIPVAADTYQIQGGDLGNQARVKYRVKQIDVTQKGSGYITAPAITWNSSGVVGTPPGSTTSALTTDSGTFLGSGNNVGTDQNAATNQENAIIIHANTTGSGTKIGDIIKQKGSSRYQVRTADGIATVKLVASDTPAIGEAYITATDHTTTANYWVTKLTAHRATIYPKGDGTPDFPLDGPLGNEPQHVGWTFGTATAPSTGVLGTVKIENA